jgi:hypothetical protein
MLVVRYFVYVGGALLALLLVCAAVLPKPSPTEGTVASADDVPAIRIQSDRKLPARVVFDTSAPMPAAPATVAQEQAPIQPPAAEAAAAARLQEAFGQAPSDEPQQKQAVAEVKKSKSVVRRRIARARMAPSPYGAQYNGSYSRYGYNSGYGPYGYGRQPMQVAQQPRFGFFW